MNQLPSKPPSTNSIVESIKQNSGMQLMLFMVLWLLCNMLAAAISSTIASIAGINDLNLLLEGFKDGQYLEHINTIKIISIASHLCQYLLPVVLYLVVVHNDAKLKVLYVDKAPNLFKLGLAVVVIAAIYPFISYVYYWNTQLIPKDAIAQDTLDVQNLMMQMQTISDLLLNLLLFGLVAGLGEEFFYRGILQKLFTKRTRNVHIGALLTAITFSLMHFQPEGFLPRFILGGIFSYLLIISANLWISVVVHILFNSTQVLVPYFYPKFSSSINTIESVPFYVACLSLFLFIGLFYTFKYVYKSNSTQYYLNQEQ